MINLLLKPLQLAVLLRQRLSSAVGASVFILTLLCCSCIPAVHILSSRLILMVKDTRNSEFVARVNGTVITRSQLQNRLNMDTTDKAHALSNLIDETLLVQIAWDQGINMHQQARDYMAANAARVRTVERTTGMNENDLEKITEEGLLAQAVAKNISSSFPVTYSETRNYYARSADDFMAPETVRMSEILIAPCGIRKDPYLMFQNQDKNVLEALQKAEKIHRLVLKGEKFEDAARHFSSGVTAKNGGDLGIFMKDSMDKSIASVVFTMPVGSVSEVITTRGGFILLHVTEHSQAHLRSFSDAKADVMAVLARQTLGEYLDSTRSASILEVRSGFVDEVNQELDTSPSDPKQDLFISIILLCIALGSIIVIELILHNQLLVPHQ